MRGASHGLEKTAIPSPFCLDAVRKTQHTSPIMSFLNWFRGRSRSADGNGKGRRPFAQTTLPLISPRRGRRILRREQLFGIVRESMIRGGVLSTSYEFKVLAMDANADKFLVLVELALPAETMPDEYLLEIERWVQSSARSRHAMEVPAIYWRRKPVAEQRGTALKASMQSQTRRPNGMSSDRPTAIPVPRAPASDFHESEPVPEAHSDFTALSETQYGRL